MRNEWKICKSKRKKLAQFKVIFLYLRDNKCKIIIMNGKEKYL